MKTKLIITLAFAVALSFSAHAAMWTFGGALNTTQEVVPPPGLVLPPFYLGGGLLVATLDDVTGDFDLHVTYTGLTGPAIAAHIHGPAPIGVEAGVLYDIGTGSPNPMVPSFFDIFFETTLAPGEITGLTAAGTFGPGDATPLYVNIHTLANLGGEIRGQLIVSSVVPLPAALWLFTPAVGLLFARRRT